MNIGLENHPNKEGLKWKFLDLKRPRGDEIPKDFKGGTGGEDYLFSPNI